MMNDTGGRQERADTYAPASSVAIICRLNDRWRVVHDGRGKPYGSWELQYRSGKDRWEAKSFCQHRFALLSAIHNKAGTCDPAAMTIVRNLAERANDGA